MLDIVGEEVLQLAMVNTLDQWVKDYTRYRGEEPSMLDLVFTKNQSFVQTSNIIRSGSGNFEMQCGTQTIKDGIMLSQILED
ncbi:hypothetical protein E2C01_033007 [Portunus trituberculatus]|uniref:Uncharacterized protein n=1 Tax=Portunus trituberculatus TaxID=210409 RepID=A0A5B7EWP2_PORTR|nr:hypothetical protein [Portunus trituberculatus]